MKNKRWSEEQLETIKNKSLSNRELAIRFNVSEAAISSLRSRLERSKFGENCYCAVGCIPAPEVDPDDYAYSVGRSFAAVKETLRSGYFPPGLILLSRRTGKKLMVVGNYCSTQKLKVVG